MSRRDARTIAMRSLFAWSSLRNSLRKKRSGHGGRRGYPGYPEKGPGLCLDLVNGVRENQEALDGELNGLDAKWTLKRMNGIDRNLLRIAGYEMFCSPEPVPPAVAINEPWNWPKSMGGTILPPSSTVFWGAW